MYTRHFSLDEPPFSIAPNPRYLFLSPQHREALAHLLYGIGVGGGFVALTGEVGTGKTTLCRCLLEQLPEDVEVALIFNPRLNSRELLASLCDELHIANPGAKGSLKQLIDILNHHLLYAHARGRRTIVLIDEAQNLSFDVLEQVRLLTNLETNQAKLLQIILVGQPELNTLLARPNLRQLSQRITARYHLKPLSLRETRDYVRHRLAVAGGSENLFTGPAIRAIFHTSGGIPRLINLMADRALLGAYTLGRHRVSWWVVRKAGRELFPSRRAGFSWRGGTLLVLVLALTAVYWAASPGNLGLERGESAALAQRSGTDRAAASSTLPETPGSGPTLSLPPAGAGETKPPAAFSERLMEPGLTRQAALRHLLSLWRPETRFGTGGEVCATAQRHGLRCLSLNGTWPQLRGINRPAVLEFVLPNGERRYAALVQVTDGKAELVLGEAAGVFALGDVLSLWKGAALLLWRPPEGRTKPVVPGERSEWVRWLRERLGAAAGPGGEENYFDEGLQARVIAFQAERGLSPDGVVGPQTMLFLDKKTGDTAGPRLDTTLH